jgi:hypothetical protein
MIQINMASLVVATDTELTDLKSDVNHSIHSLFVVKAENSVVFEIRELLPKLFHELLHVHFKLLKTAVATVRLGAFRKDRIRIRIRTGARLRLVVIVMLMLMLMLITIHMFVKSLAKISPFVIVGKQKAKPGQNLDSMNGHWGSGTGLLLL